MMMTMVQASYCYTLLAWEVMVEVIVAVMIIVLRMRTFRRLSLKVPVCVMMHTRGGRLQVRWMVWVRPQIVVEVEQLTATRVIVNLTDSAAGRVDVVVSIRLSIDMSKSFGVVDRSLPTVALICVGLTSRFRITMVVTRVGHRVTAN